MNEELFNALLQQLSNLASKIDALTENNTPENIQEALEDSKNNPNMKDGEKRKVTKIAKIFAKEFKELSEKKDDTKEKTEVSLDKDSFKMLRKTISSVIPEFGKIIKESMGKQKKEKSGGILGFLGSVLGGAFNAFGAINKMIPFLITAGGIALAFYVVKNIEKISKAIDTVLKSGKENLPTILESMAKNLFPFYKEFLSTAEAFLKRILDTIDRGIEQLPKLFDILLKNLPVIRETVTGFANDLIDISKKFSEMTLAEKITAIGVAVGTFLGAKVALGLLTNTLGSLKGLAAGGAFLLIGEGLKSIAEAAKMFGDLSWENLGKAGAALTGIGVAVKGLSAMKPSWDIFFGILGAGAVSGGLIALLPKLADALKPWNDVSTKALEGAGMALATVLGTLAVFAIPGTGEAAAIGGLFGSAGLLVTGGTFTAAIRAIGEAFEATIDTYERLPAVFKGFAEINYAKLFNVAGSIVALTAALAFKSVQGGVSAIADTFTNIWGKLTGQKSPVEAIREYESLDAAKLDTVSKSIERIFTALNRTGNLNIDKIKQSVEALKELTKFDNKGNIISVGSPQGPVAQDFISRPGMAPLRFSPQDTVVALKKPELFGKDISDSINKLTADLKENSRKSLIVFNEMNEKLNKLNENKSVNMINNSRNSTNITISPTTSKSFRDERYAYPV